MIDVEIFIKRDFHFLPQSIPLKLILNLKYRFLFSYKIFVLYISFKFGKKFAQLNCNEPEIKNKYVLNELVFSTELSCFFEAISLKDTVG